MNQYDIQWKLFNFYCLGYILSMMRNEKKNAEQLRRLQNRRIQKLALRAYEVPFWKKRFDEGGVDPKSIRTREDLAKLPTLTKEEYRAWMNEELETPIVKNFKFTHTSGSTGIPTTNIYPPKEYAQHYMMDMFCWMQGGYNPFFGKALTCSPGDASVGMGTFIQRLGILRRECFSMEWDKKDIVAKINSYQPDFLLGYSAELAFIAQYALENDIPVHKPEYYCAGGEHVMGETERVLKQAFGDGMINYYGCTEMADFAVRKPGEDYYHVFEDCVAVSVMTDRGIHSEGTGTVLATPLFRMQYPLINYEIGDIVTLKQMDGRDVLTEMCGRKQDMFVWRSGKKTTHKDIWLISRTLEDVYQIRFIQDSYDKLVLQVVQDPKSKKDRAALEDYLRKKYEPVIDEDVQITFEWLQVIPPDPNGKIRNMISKVSN